jgi:hypothetical protein
MKNPCVLDEILAPRGLMEILESSPSSDFSSMANRSNLSFVKHNLNRTSSKWRAIRTILSAIIKTQNMISVEKKIFSSLIQLDQMAIYKKSEQSM